MQFALHCDLQNFQRIFQLLSFSAISSHRQAPAPTSLTAFTYIVQHFVTQLTKDCVLVPRPGMQRKQCMMRYQIWGFRQQQEGKSHSLQHVACDDAKRIWRIETNTFYGLLKQVLYLQRK